MKVRCKYVNFSSDVKPKHDSGKPIAVLKNSKIYRAFYVLIMFSYCFRPTCTIFCTSYFKKQYMAIAHPSTLFSLLFLYTFPFFHRRINVCELRFLATATIVYRAYLFRGLIMPTIALTWAYK